MDVRKDQTKDQDGIATHLWYAKSSIKWNLMAIETWEPADEFTNPWQLKLLAVNPNAL